MLIVYSLPGGPRIGAAGIEFVGLVHGRWSTQLYLGQLPNWQVGGVRTLRYSRSLCLSASSQRLLISAVGLYPYNHWVFYRMRIQLFERLS